VQRFVYDPYGFVLWAFPWGSGELEGEEGPDVWQARQLMEVGSTWLDDPEATIQEAIASGHGIGKSAQVSWLILWMMATRPFLAGWVTANTKTQLTSKTWRELAVWHNRLICRHWFKWSPTRFFHVDHPKTWGVDAIPWSAHNSEAFAGLHAKHVLMMMDEASGIDDVIWEVASGAMTTPRAAWFVFGNPTKNTGMFRECFGRNRHRWRCRQIDSRSCKKTNKAKLQEWIDDNGLDSDYVRVRVRGEFPRVGTNQLISSEDVQLARDFEIPSEDHLHFPITIGVDVARFGQDETVVLVRQGRKVLEIKAYRGLNNIQAGARVAEIYREYGEGTIQVDEVGLGGGVVDYLNTAGYPVIGVNAGSRADDDRRYYNKRAEMWHRMSKWLETSVDIPDDPVLCDQLVALEYEYDLKERIKLERKEDLKERLPGLGSPDRAEALALTFANVIAPNRTTRSFEPEPEIEAI